MNPISTGADWDFELLERYDAAIGEIAAEFKLDTYPNQIEVITSEQMLDAYASAGLPVGYPHWSYGKEFIRNEQAYRRGMVRYALRRIALPIPRVCQNDRSRFEAVAAGVVLRCRSLRVLATCQRSRRK